MEVLIFAEHDDPDVEPLSHGLGRLGFRTTWFKLGLQHSSYDLDVDVESARATSNGVTVDDQVVHKASVVVYRRWKSCPSFPAVAAQIPGDDYHFGQREWCAAVEYTIQRWHTNRPTTQFWSRDPGAVREKLHLLDAARHSGASVPQFRIAVRQDRIVGPHVAKAIALNQEVMPGSRLPTSRITENGATALASGLQPCPTLVQPEIPVQVELRVGYAFGHCAAVAQVRERDIESGYAVDIRYVAELERARTPLPNAIRDNLRAFAAATGIQMFTADLLVERATDVYWLVDINPDGLFVAADSDDSTLVECAVAGISSPR